MLAILLLAACGGVVPSNWPGLSADPDQGLVYLAYLSHIFALRASDGSLAWRFPQEADNHVVYYAPPEAAGQQVIAGSYSHVLHSINVPSQGDYGTTRWQFDQTKGRFIGGVLVAGETILAPSSDHNLYALDLQGGLRWKFTAGNGFWARPVSDGERVYLPSMDHFLYALSLAGGDLVWKLDLGAAAVASAELYQGVLYQGTLGKQMVAVDAETGKLLWRAATEGTVWAKPVYHQTPEGGVIYFGDMSGNLYALNVADGSQRWKLSAGGPVIATAAAIPEGLVFVHENGGVQAISFGGEKLWTRTFNGKLYTSPVVAGERVVMAVTGGDHLLVALDFRGNDAWSFDPPK